MKNTILVVDDEPVQRRLLEATLEKLNYNVVSVEGGQQAIDYLAGKAGSTINAVVLDLVMPEIDGMAVLEAMRKHQLNQPVIVQTAQGGVDTAVNAMRAGAVDFVIKPASPQRLKTSLENALKVEALQVQVKRKKQSNSCKGAEREIISASPNMDRIKNIARKAAGSNIPVLIGGESGTGKELIARAIQSMSDRSANNFVIVNCGALPENLAESILFGHEKGSFTGASEKRLGKFREADGGTLFLDEVGELPADIQVKLLRALQEGEIDPVGSSKSVKVNVRIISATNRDLLEEVNAGSFREDLYNRLNVLPINLPPLRERKEDIPALLDHFVKRICEQEGRETAPTIDANTAKMLSSYDWPGNIRQLENAMFRAIVLCDGAKLTVDEFPQIAIEQGLDQKTFEETPVMETPLPEVDTSNAKSHPASIDASDVIPLLDGDDVITLEAAEKMIMEFAINHYRGKMAKVAKKLGIGRSTLYRKLRDYGLEDSL